MSDKSFLSMDQRNALIVWIQSLSTAEQVRFSLIFARLLGDDLVSQAAEDMILKLEKKTDFPVMRGEIDASNDPHNLSRFVLGNRPPPLSGFNGSPERHGTGLPPTGFGRPFSPPATGADEQPFAPLRPDEPLENYNEVVIPGRELVDTPPAHRNPIDEGVDQAMTNWFINHPAEDNQKTTDHEE